LTILGGIVVVVATGFFCVWTLDLVRRGRLYVGYGIVVLVLACLVAAVSVVPFSAQIASRLMNALFPREPIAVIGLSAILVLLVYVLNQLSVVSERVSNLTQELAIRDRRDQGPDDRPNAPE
jgi:hypothetical protein